MVETIAPTLDRPGWRSMGGLTAVSIRHFAEDTSARDAVRAQGLAWSDAPGELTGGGPWLAWRSPQETLVFGLEHPAQHALLQALAPGRSETALAVDLSEALVVLELLGPKLEIWLSHLVDASAIPRTPGRVARCRLADAAVLLARLGSERVWLVADRPVTPYLSNWLSYSHEGAFGTVR